MTNKPIIQDIAKLLKRDHGFKLPLPTLVKGINALGKSFEEKTELSYISHKGGSFWLKNPILFGSNLKLNIDLPAKLGREGLKLYLQGKVVFIEALNCNYFCQRVSLKFENNFIIQACNEGFYNAFSSKEKTISLSRLEKRKENHPEIHLKRRLTDKSASAKIIS